MSPIEIVFGFAGVAGASSGGGGGGGASTGGGGGGSSESGWDGLVSAAGDAGAGSRPADAGGAAIAGESTRLAWEAANAAHISIEPGIGDVSGRTEADAKPAKPTLYSLTATGPGGSVTATTFVDVASTVSVARRLLKDAADKQHAGLLKEALALYRQSAQMGEPRAMEALGEIFLDGKGVAESAAEASAWFRKAADGGELTAMLYLGYLYESGVGIAQNYPSAIHWFGKAADAGNPAAMFDLGTMYENGQGVAVNLDKARELYRKAASLGNVEAKRRLDKLQNGKKQP